MAESEKFVEMTLPVWLPSAMRKPPVDFVQAKIRDLSGDDAPVALRYHALSGHGIRDTTDYRSFDGRLWQRAGSMVGTNRQGRPYEPPRNFDVKWDGMELGRLRLRVDAMQAAYMGRGNPPHGRFYEDVRNAFQRPLGTGVVTTAKRSTVYHADRVAIAREAEAFVGNAIVVDGEIWRRTDGPVVMAHSGYNITGALLLGRDECEMNEQPNHRASRMDCRDVERTRRLSQEAFGNANLRQDRFEIEELLPVSQESFERESVELAIWNFYWQVKWQGLAQSSGPALVEAYMSARNALERRWKGTAVDWDPKGHDTLAQHLWNAPPLLPHDLLPVLEKIVAASEGAIADNFVRTWRLSLIRGQEYVRTLGREVDAAQALTDFGI